MRRAEYTSTKAKAAGFSLTTCNGLDAPTKGCKDFWGKAVSPPQSCWFGRGALQLSWPGNYDQVRSKVGSVDLCSDPDAVCTDGKVGFETAIAFWTSNQAPWKASYSMLDAVTGVVKPHDTATNNARVQMYNEWLKAIGISVPVSPTSSPASAQYTSRCGATWADATGKCGTLCPKGTNEECAAGGGGSCFASLDPSPCATVPTAAPTTKQPSQAGTASSMPTFSPGGELAASPLHSPYERSPLERVLVRMPVGTGRANYYIALRRDVGRCYRQVRHVVPERHQ